MDVTDIKKLLVVFSIIIVMVSGYYIFDFEQKKDLDGEFNSSVSYVSEFNISNSNEFEVETEYISFDGMRSFESDSINVESESCLRFTDFDGNLVLDTETEIIGEASGFATCTLNATTEIQVEETKEVSMISTRDLINNPSYSFENVNSSIELLEQDKEIEETNAEIVINEFNGSIELKPPDTVYLYGESGLKIDDREID